MILRFLSLMTEGSHWLKRWPGKRSMFEGKMINSVLNMLCLMSLWDSDETSRRHLKLECWSSGKLFGLNIWVKEPSTSLQRQPTHKRRCSRTEFHIPEKFNEKRERKTHKGSLHSFSMVNYAPMPLWSEGSTRGHEAQCPLFIGEETGSQRGGSDL